MADSLILDWLAENAHRSYPLRYDAGTMPLALDGVLLDACLIFEGAAVTGAPIHLTSLVVSGQTVTFNVTDQAPFVLTNRVSTVVVANGVSLTVLTVYPHYLRNATNSLLVIGEAVKEAVTSSPLNARFEDSLCHLLNAPWQGVSSFSAGAGAVSGAAVWTEGAQFGLVGDAAKSSVELKADRNAGTPLGCASHFGVAQPCDSVIAWLNGVGVPVQLGDLKLIAGDNVAIFEDPENHRIYIGLNFKKTDVCPVIRTHPRSPV